MRTTLAILVLSMASIANATAVSIPTESLETYKSAVLTSMNGIGYDCKAVAGVGSYADTSAIAAATEGTVDMAGGQPLLTLSHSNYKGVTVITVTSTANFKEVVSYTSETFVMGDVNSGDLRTPSMGKGLVSDGKALCTKMKSKYER